MILRKRKEYNVQIEIVFNTSCTCWDTFSLKYLFDTFIKVRIKDF